MRSAKSTVLPDFLRFPALLLMLTLLAAQTGHAQNNSPYSRYGLGDQAPNTHILNRGMGGVAVSDTDFLHINFTNPASYSNFASVTDPRTGKLLTGRVLLDAGINLESRTLRQPNKAGKFTSSDLYFNYIQLGVPLRKGWGLAFGIRPLTRVSYKIVNNRRIPGIDSILTEYNGSGGSYLPSIGTGLAIKNLSLGLNVGYLFGRREASTATGPVNDSVDYENALFKSEVAYGRLFASGGMQYKINLKDNGNRYLHLGASGNVKQKLNTRQDITQGTFGQDPNAPLNDSLVKLKDVEGEIIYPSSYTVGFILGGYGVNAKDGKRNGSAWQLGVDYVHTGWDDFRFLGVKDAVKDDWQLRMGAQFRPVQTSNFASQISYRAGFFTGSDYINAGGDMSIWGASFGLGLPLRNFNRQVPNQFTIVNLALEYNNRGGNENLIKENMFRFSLGLNLSDLWFSKRRYD